MGLDSRQVRRDFPVLRRRVPTADGKTRPLVYLDHGASTHAPTPVLEAVQDFCSNHYANVHRGLHRLSQEASEAFEDACSSLARFVGADAATQPVVMAQNTTQALDLAAHLMAGQRGRTLVTLAEHHSNDLPHRRRGAIVRARVDGEGRIDLEDVEAKLSSRAPGRRVKLLAVTGASNVTGVMPPIHHLARLAHDHGARILVDAAQLYAHAPIDVKPQGHPEHIDFLAAAGHKAYAPFGSAFLLAPRDVLDAADPYMPGGGTVEWVTEDDVQFTTGTERHQGGTPNIVGAIAFAAATRYLSSHGMEEVRSHEQALTSQALRAFRDLAAEGVRLLGPAREKDAAEKVGVFAFVCGRPHEDVAATLDREYAIATRNGCFCAQPLLNHLLGLGVRPEWTKVGRGHGVAIPGATRASLGIYNSEEEVRLLRDALQEIVRRSPAPVGVRQPLRAEVS